jgi:hypothetical protein
MAWSTVNFGKHKGKTLPQIVFTDPDYFFWAMGEGVFRKKGDLEREAKDIWHKARNIRIPGNDKDQLRAEYSIHFPTGKFGDMEIVPVSQARHEGSTRTIRKNVIDLNVPRQLASYDKLGCRTLLSCVKYALFRSSKARMTREKCEKFFADDRNFVIR